MPVSFNDLASRASHWYIMNSMIKTLAATLRLLATALNAAANVLAPRNKPSWRQVMHARGEATRRETQGELATQGTAKKVEWVGGGILVSEKVGDQDG